MSLSTEIICAKEAGRVLLRDFKKYNAIIPTLYLAGVLNPRVISLIRHGYAFIRNIDDVIDGDLDAGIGPMEYVSEVKKQLCSGLYEKRFPIMKTVDHILANSNCKTDPRVHLGSLIDVLVFDYERARDRIELSGEGLDEHYKKTFFPLVDLMFGFMESSLTAEDVPVFAYGQASWQNFRDLKKDWNEGRINIPKEILSAAGISSASSIEEVTGNDTVQDWFAKELYAAKQGFRRLGEDYKNHPEILPRFILNYASRYHCKRIPDRWSFLFYYPVAYKPEPVADSS